MFLEACDRTLSVADPNTRVCGERLFIRREIFAANFSLNAQKTSIHTWAKSKKGNCGVLAFGTTRVDAETKANKGHRISSPSSGLKARIKSRVVSQTFERLDSVYLARDLVLASPSKAGSVNLVARFANYDATTNTKPNSSNRSSALLGWAPEACRKICVK